VLVGGSIFLLAVLGYNALAGKGNGHVST